MTAEQFWMSNKAPAWWNGVIAANAAVFTFFWHVTRAHPLDWGDIYFAAVLITNVYYLCTKR